MTRNDAPDAWPLSGHFEAAKSRFFTAPLVNRWWLDGLPFFFAARFFGSGWAKAVTFLATIYRFCMDRFVKTYDTPTPHR